MLLIFTVALMQLVVRRKSASFAQECWLAFCTFLLYIMRCRMGTPKRNNNSLQYSIWLKIQSMTTEHSSVANALSLFNQYNSNINVIKSVQRRLACNDLFICLFLFTRYTKWQHFYCLILFQIIGAKSSVTSKQD